MDFSQFVEYVTTDGVHHVAPQQHELDNPLVLDTVRGGYEHAAQLGRAWTLAAGELDALKAAAPYHADVVAHEMVSDDPAEIIERLIVVRSYPEWHVGLQCEVADLERTKGVYFNPADNNLYVCIQLHKAQLDWRPDLPNLGSLWLRFYEPEAGPQPWVQPYGGSGTYVSGAIVTHNGFVWRNIIPPPTLNVWEPGVYGWEVVT